MPGPRHAKGKAIERVVLVFLADIKVLLIESGGLGGKPLLRDLSPGRGQKPGLGAFLVGGETLAHYLLPSFSIRVTEVCKLGRVTYTRLIGILTTFKCG